MIIYKITNTIDGKIYIGKTTTKLRVRWSGHKSSHKKLNETTKLYNAMRKHGVENFKIEQIDSANNLRDLKEKEYYWIDELNSTKDEIGYNIQYGNEEGNMNMDDETKIKIVSSLKEKKIQDFIKCPQREHKTKYIGVYFDNNKKMWGYAFQANKKKICNRRYETDLNAAIGRDIRLLQHFDEEEAIKMMNFPENFTLYKEGKIQNPIINRKIEVKKSNYLGVLYEKTLNRWVASVTHQKIRYKHGTFKSEKDAAEMADYIKIKNGINSKLNFSDIDYYSPCYIPPKNVESNRKFPKYVSSFTNTCGKTRYRVRCCKLCIDEYFENLEDATRFQNSVIQS
jgi:group I intron endonuclease